MACYRDIAGRRVRVMCGGATVPNGPGTELRKLLTELAIRPKPGCACAAMEREMNRLGPDGCQRERETLAKRLKQKAAAFGLGDWAAAAARAATSGLAL